MEKENEDTKVGFDFTKLLIGLGILVVFGFLVVRFGFDTSDDTTNQAQDTVSSHNQAVSDTLSLQGEQEGGDFMAADVDELAVEDLEVGTGEEAVAGKEVTVHYTGWLTDGTKFDSSVDRGQPFTFQLGAGYVIQGWDQGVAGMKVGGKRKLTIPSELGYGERGAGASIPPGATLVFEVELLEVN